MSRSLPVAALLLLLMCRLPGLAEEDEPAVAGQKLSAWLAHLQEDKEAKQRRRAVAALDLIGAPKSRKILPALVKALREDKEEIVREKAALAVGKGISALLSEARAEKREDLPRVDEPREALIITVRTDASGLVREAAAKGLATLGTDARSAAGALGGALKDKHPGTVLAAADALRRLGKEAREAQADLLALLADRKADNQARADAAFTLGQISPEAREVLPTFKDVFGDASAPAALRKNVVESIGKLGKDGAETAPLLATLLTDKNASADLRLACVGVLDQWGTEARSTLPALIKATRDDDRYVRSVALHAIGRMGKVIEMQRKPAVEAIFTGLEDTSQEVRLAAIEALVALGVDGLHSETSEAIRRLKQLLERETRKPIREATQAAIDKIVPKK
jgi:HEAT repeat protein